MMKYSFLLLVVAVSLSSCFLVEGRRVRGNGDLTTEERTLKNFNGVVSHGSFDVYLTTGSEYSVKVEADANILQYIETEIEGGNLQINTADGYSLRSRDGMKVYITAPSFNTVRVSGSGNISGKNVIASNDNMNIGVSGSGNIDMDVRAIAVSADISGSGNIKLSGEADKLSTSISGSGDMRAPTLKTEETKVSIAGSGNANVTASRQLDVSIAGSGGVNYTGNPAVSSRIAGSGSVNKID